MKSIFDCIFSKKGRAIIANSNIKPRTPNAKRKNTQADNSALHYKCTRCGKTEADAKGSFYVSNKSPLFVSNDYYCHICVGCTNELFSEIENRFKDTKIALIVVCHYLDIFFSEELYESIKGNANFSFGSYLRLINGTQYKSKNFTNSLMGIVQDGLRGSQAIAEEKETKWSSSDLQNKRDAMEAIGYDPFEGYTETDRKFLFNELVKYFDEDISDDAFKLSQVIQIVNNNNQIRNIDLTIAQLSTSINIGLKSDEIKTLIQIKNQLVQSNDKIAKENEISVKNRSNKDIGKSTLGKLQINLRKMNFDDAEENFYTQLSSRGSRWATDMSHKSIVDNAMFDENDKQEIFNSTRENYIKTQQELDDIKEKCRLLQKEIDSLKCEVVNKK